MKTICNIIQFKRYCINHYRQNAIYNYEFHTVPSVLKNLPIVSLRLFEVTLLLTSPKTPQKEFWMSESVPTKMTILLKYHSGKFNSLKCCQIFSFFARLN